jgi:DNA-binding LacI/PurR family transcriptional regulator
MSLTLRQLAAHINVAPSTISRALSRESGVSDEKAAEIRRMAARLGYRPKPMRRRINKTIGLIVSSAFEHEPDDAYQATLIANAMVLVGDAGWHLHSEVVARDGESSKLVVENRVDGVLLCGHPTRALCDKIREMGTPAVVLDDLYERTGLPSVIADVGGATRQVIERLRAMGHRRIAMVVTSDQFPTMARRIEGYRQALADQRHDDQLLVHVGYSTLQQGQIATRQLMRRPDPPTVLVYATDRLAVGGMIEMARRGLDVPHDVSIVGHDNSSLARETDPALTSVDLNVPQMLKLAFETLRDLIESGRQEPPPEAVQQTVESKVIWRNSCGPFVGGLSA